MKSLDIKWTVKKFRQELKRGNVDFNYPIQRKGGQWDLLQKSLLIHTLAGGYPLPAFYSIAERVEEEVNGKIKKRTVYRILDGKQRFTNIDSFMIGDYPLHEDTPDVIIDDEKFELAGKFYGDLPREVIDEIENFQLLAYKLEDATDEQIEDVFFRLNNGSPLSKQQKAKSKMGTVWAGKIKSLVEHPLMLEKASFTALQLRKADDETAVLQTMMLIDDNYEVRSISSNDVFDYAQTFKGQDDKDVLVDKVKNAMDYLDKAFEGKENVLLKKVHFPMTIITAITAMEMGVHPTKFSDWKEEFKKALKLKSDIKTNYKSYGGAGSVKKPKAEGRINEMKKHLEKYLGQAKAPAEEVLEVIDAKGTEKETDIPVEPVEPVETIETTVEVEDVKVEVPEEDGEKKSAETAK